jgi:hypothetical protein
MLPSLPRLRRRLVPPMTFAVCPRACPRPVTLVPVIYPPIVRRIVPFVGNVNCLMPRPYIWSALAAIESRLQFWSVPIARNHLTRSSPNSALILTKICTAISLGVVQRLGGPGVAVRPPEGLECVPSLRPGSRGGKMTGKRGVAKGKGKAKKVGAKKAAGGGKGAKRPRQGTKGSGQVKIKPGPRYARRK